MTDSARVHLDFTGCRLNEAEIQHLADVFAAQGNLITPESHQADLIILNTCAVTNQATRKSRQMILQAGRSAPDARIIVTGCYAELDPRMVGGLPGVTHVIGNAGKDNLADGLFGAEIPLYDKEPLARDRCLPGTLGRTRAFIKVQDGCDNKCTFCVTTLARGAGRSRPARAIIDEINQLHEVGYQEAVLTGVHLGSYGHDLGNPDGLADLVRSLLRETLIPRLRLSSLEPWDLTDDFFDLWADQRLCPHLHLPLQSGSDGVLRRMARRCTRMDFSRLVEAAHRKIDNLCLTSDMLVGFPGESESEFADSLAFAGSVGFARLHVFPYSPRPGTAAARMAGQVSAAIKKDRSRRMSDLSEQLWRDYQQSQIGRICNVLWESAHGATPEGTIWSGLTENYLRVFVTTPDYLANTLTSARLDHLNEHGIEAVVY